MKKILGYILCLVLFLSLVGCGNTNRNMSEVENNGEELMNALSTEDYLSIASTGQIGFGFSDLDKDEYIYDGNEIEIPYFIENQGDSNEQESSTGLIFLVNGELQPYKIVEDGRATDEKNMHIFNLQPGEKKEFVVKFTPISGNKGDKVGIIPATLWNPTFEPENEDMVKFGNCYQMSANVPLCIDMKMDGVNKSTSSDAQYEVVEIPEKINQEYDGVEVMGSYDAADVSVGFHIETENECKKIKVKDGKIDVVIDFYGGENVCQKITLMVNNNPIKINNGDFVTMNTKKGKMCQIKTSIDANLVSDGAVVYALAMTTGDDYVVQDIFATDPVYIEK